MEFSYDNTPLGKKTAYCSHYDPSLLFPIPRSDKRGELGIKSDALPFVGQDVWTGYELSWLNAKGLPQVAVGQFIFPVESPYLIESKSFKLYLNSFNDTRFEHWSQVQEVLQQDLSQAAGVPVDVALYALEQAPQCTRQIEGTCLDTQEIEIQDFVLTPDYLSAQGAVVSETLYSNLLKSNCLVTGQPDWGTVVVRYSGARIDRAGLLRYIVSFRHHWEFHEQCVERIYMDLQRVCQPEKLLVYARYVRRGGLEINPYRASEPGDWSLSRLVRQ